MPYLGPPLLTRLASHVTSSCSAGPPKVYCSLWRALVAFGVYWKPEAMLKDLWSLWRACRCLTQTGCPWEGSGKRAVAMPSVMWLTGPTPPPTPTWLGLPWETWRKNDGLEPCFPNWISSGSWVPHNPGSTSGGFPGPQSTSLAVPFPGMSSGP